MMKSDASFASVRTRARVNHDPQIKLFNRRSPLTLPPPPSPCPKVINYAAVAPVCLIKESLVFQREFACRFTFLIAGVVSPRLSANPSATPFCERRGEAQPVSFSLTSTLREHSRLLPTRMNPLPKHFARLHDVQLNVVHRATVIFNQRTFSGTARGDRTSRSASRDHTPSKKSRLSDYRADYNA